MDGRDWSVLLERSFVNCSSFSFSLFCLFFDTPSFGLLLRRLKTRRMPQDKGSKKEREMERELVRKRKEKDQNETVPNKRSHYLRLNMTFKISVSMFGARIYVM